MPTEDGNKWDQEALDWLHEISAPDMTMLAFVKMIHDGWYKYHELAAAVAACRDINDSGEEYTHPNADGAQALANLFSMIKD
jgi:lysophospholipase L1-like esterase